MAGETVRARAVCLEIRPWSRTSHIVSWLSGTGRVATVVKGAVRPKSAFLGQYDLNYTCDIVYYARARGELHALRECAPVDRRDALRSDFRALALADYFRRTVRELAPSGPDCAEWMELLEQSLDGLAEGSKDAADASGTGPGVGRMLAFEMAALGLAGLSPDLLGDETGGFQLRGERKMPVTGEIASCLRSPMDEKNPKILLDAARVIGVFYAFHLDCASDVRRTVLRMISNNE